MIFKCPGAGRFRQPYPEEKKCPYCGNEVEIWTDEVRAICPECKNSITRMAPQSCLDWCKYASECVGKEVYENILKIN